MVATILALTLSLMLSQSTSGQAAGGIKMSAPAGTEWEVLAGYNTATHEGVDPYALDLWRVDDETGGTPVLAPFAGEIGYSSATCLSIVNDEVDLLICHIHADTSLERGDEVAVGQHLGTVAPDGEAANNGIAHLHLQLNERDDSPGSTGASMPFAGNYAIEGVSLEPTTETNGHYGRRFVSTNSGGSIVPLVDAGEDRTVSPGEAVTLSAQTSGVSNVSWAQQSGPSVAMNVAQGRTFTFVAPTEGGSLTFQVIGTGGGTVVTDEIRITVQPSPAEPAPPTIPSLLEGEVFPGGISVVVFSGGTTEELIEAVGCPLPTLGMWASAPNGNLVQYTVGRPAFVNASWDALFPTGLPELTPLLLKCS